MINTPNKEHKKAIEMTINKLVNNATEKKLMQDTFLAECVIVHENEDQTNNGQETSVLKTIKTYSNSENQDPLVEMNLGTQEEPQVTFISGHLRQEEFARILEVLKKYKDCFAWSYTELPGLNRKLVEHRLPIKTGFKPYQQAARRMAPDIILKVKEEIERLVTANFIRPARYVEWLSNIVL